MGVDFLKSKAKAFVKGWDLSRLELTRKDLFTREPNCLATGAVARTLGSAFSVGDTVLVRVDDNRLVVIRDLAIQAVFLEPPPDVFDRIRASGGYANGEITGAFSEIQLVEVTIR